MLALSACATRPTPPSSLPQAKTEQSHQTNLANIKSFALKGRLGVVTQKQGFSGGINWQHKTNFDNIDIYSPLGGKVANIAKDSSGVTLISQDGQNIHAQDAESLTLKALGFKLPLTGLSDWVLGKASAGKIDAMSTDELGRLKALKQDGWDISYENYAESYGVALPNKILLKSEQVNLKIIIEKWLDH